MVGQRKAPQASRPARRRRALDRAWCIGWRDPPRPAYSPSNFNARTPWAQQWLM